MYFIYSLIFLFSSCRKSELVLPTPTYTTPCTDTTNQMKYLWRIPLNADTGQVVGSPIFTFEDKVAAIVAENNVQKIVTRYATTGQHLWTWERPNNLTAISTKNLNYYYYDNQIIINNYFRTIFLNAQTGQPTVLPMPQGTIGGTRSTLIGNSIYQEISPNDKDWRYIDTTYLMRLKIGKTQWDTICMLKQQDNAGYRGFIEPPALHINNQGDSVVMFKYRAIPPPNLPVTSNGLFFFAYNMTQKRMVWRKDTFENDGSVYPPIVDNDKVYVDGLGTIYCFNAHTGDLLWSRYIGSRLVGGTGLFLYKDRIATISLGGRFVVLDKNNGNIIYNYQDGSNGDYDLNTPSNAVVFNGVMYVMAGGYFYGLNLDTGAIMGKYKAPTYKCNRQGLFGYSSIAVNTQAKCIYLDDEHFLYCVKAFK